MRQLVATGGKFIASQAAATHPERLELCLFLKHFYPPFIPREQPLGISA